MVRFTARVFESIWYGRNPWRWLLWPLSLLFRLAARLRAAFYRAGSKRRVELRVPVVVVGNISVGGTGKTPFIIWLAAQLRQRGLAPGIVSRGYRGAAASWPQWVEADSDPRHVGDEPVLLARRTGCPVAAGPDRVAAAEHLLSKAAVDVLLSDDGLQHYRLARAFEIVIIDGLRGLGNGMCLPAGPLREPVSRLATVDAVVVNGGAADGDGGTDAFRAELVATRVYRLIDDKPAALADFARQTVHAVAGIGHPERFFRLLEHAGLGVIRHPLPDHADIPASDLRYEPAAPVLVTEKDAVKCRAVAHGDVWCVAVDLVFEQHAAERLMRSVVEALHEGRRAALRD